MSKAQDEISELMDLQREASRKRPRPTKAKTRKKPTVSEEAARVDETEPKQETGKPGADPDGTEDPRSEVEERIKELSENIESAVQEIDNAAKEQPALVSLVAFTLGLVLGQSLSRR